ncbi:hypothetical protein BT63DRAFT_424593 [Microthyrium microscopicum]|uniref:Chromo domain-containing protein n=1 Tax=Microthyrium microscopicum TaxID=703497 RepID=A0A6A6UEQ4_9PEZI|nr:hypothetical protein BT63DRAFT_424593 [Microthyrium microscopicum]
MPPPLIEDENASGTESEDGIEFKVAKADQDEEDEEDEDDEEGGEDEFIVEEIKAHRFDKDVLKFHVKWQGYPALKDHTWEPEENLATAPEVLSEYFDSIGGRPAPPGGSKKRGPKAGSKRSFSESNAASPDPAPAKGKRGRKKRAAMNGDGEDDVEDAPKRANRKYPPATDSNWDKYIVTIETIETIKTATGEDSNVALVTWDNGDTSRHALRLMHQCAKDSMLKFYEAHLSFRVADSSHSSELPTRTKDDDEMDVGAEFDDEA